MAPFFKNDEKKRSLESQDEFYWTSTHDLACQEGQDFYMDPQTGLLVFTCLKLQRRGYCCDSGCRHCPYKKKGEPPERNSP